MDDASQESRSTNEKEATHDGPSSTKREDCGAATPRNKTKKLTYAFPHRFKGLLDKIDEEKLNKAYSTTLNVFTFIAPLIIPFTTWETAHSSKDSYNPTEKVGDLCFPQFLQIVSTFSILILVALIFTHRRIVCVILRARNRLSINRVWTASQSSDDGEEDRREAIIIMTVFIVIFEVFHVSTHSPVTLFRTPLGGAVLGLVTIQMLHKLGMSLVKLYDFEETKIQGGS